MSEAPEAPANESMTFDSFGLYPDVLRALTESGYTKPTPIQAAAIPVVTTGHDVIGAAQTGTDKAVGLSLPIIRNLLPDANTSASPARHPVRAPILTPTRELANQAYDNVAKYAKYMALRSTVVSGGVDVNPQTEQLRCGVETLVATPGRLLNHVQQRSVNLSQIRMPVLDEADRVLDMGFLPGLQRIINLLPAHRQTLPFSATFSPEIRGLAASYLRHPQAIEVVRSNATAESVRQIIYTVPGNHKQAALVYLLCQHTEQGLPRQCIVFSNSKIGCSHLARALEREGINANVIHGDKTQTERMQTLEAFKQGIVDVLVATDVAAHGLNISQMSCVINLDLPLNAEDYVHRTGRTGRAGASGDALSLFAPGGERLLAGIERLIKRNLPREQLADFDPTGEQACDRERRERDEKRARSEVRRSREREDRNGTRVLDHTIVRPALRPSDNPSFNRPYESSVPAEPAEATKLAQAAGHPRTAKRPIAALLGGVPCKC